MIGVLIALIVAVAVVGGYYIDYLNNRVMMKADDSDIKKEVNELRSVVHQMKKRIENLETIAAGEPESFHKIDITEHQSDDSDHESVVSKMARKKRSDS